ncbi:MAG: DMT family transporter [Desulfobacterales bacterium]|nr:DMT family transporter [Desulfobacterales bacterium]
MQIIGVSCSIAAALFWALAIVLFKKSGESLSPLAMNLFKGLVTLLFFIPTLILLDVELFPDRPMGDWAIFCLSGFLGITMADTLFFMALKRLGAGMIAVVDCLYLPTVLLLSFLFLDEALGARGVLGAALVVAAIFLGSATGRSARLIPRENLIPGIIFGGLGISFLAGSIVMIKSPLEGANVVWASFVRMMFGTLGLFLAALLRPDRKALFAELRPSKAWKTVLPASILGNYIAMLAWLVGIKYTLVSVAAILNQLSTVFVFILAALFLKEPVTLPRLTATILAVSGAMLAATSAR